MSRLKKNIDPPIRPDVELRIVMLVGGFFLVIGVLLLLSVILFPGG